LLALLACVVALAACGSDHRVRQFEPTHAVTVSKAPQLVSMRRIDGATWETVIVRTDGSGDVGVFIGEMAGSGTKHRHFRLSASQLARLRLLIAHAELVRRTPDFHTVQPGVEYIVITQQKDFELAQGQVPRQLTGLVGVLNGLLDQHE
jgi:hypothetical protein